MIANPYDLFGKLVADRGYLSNKLGKREFGLSGLYWDWLLDF